MQRTESKQELASRFWLGADSHYLRNRSKGNPAVSRRREITGENPRSEAKKKKKRDLQRLLFFMKGNKLFLAGRYFAAATETSFSIGAPIRLPHSVHEPS